MPGARFLLACSAALAAAGLGLVAAFLDEPGLYAAAAIFAAAAILVFGLIARARVELADQERLVEEAQRRHLEENARFLVAVTHSDPGKTRLARELQERYPIDPDAPIGIPHVLRTGEPELYVEISDELEEDWAVDEEHLRRIRELGLRSAIVAPLKARGRTLGALTLVAGHTDRRYGADDLPFVEEVARRAGLLVDNARLHGAEQAARAEAEAAAEQTVRLQELTAHLSAAATPVEVAEILVGESREVLGARAGWVSVLNRDGTQLELLAAKGYRADFVEKYRRIPMTAAISQVAVVGDGRPKWIESTDEVPQEYPELAEGYEATGGEAVALVPLTSARRSFGFLALRFTGPRRFPTDERRVLLTLADQCAQALERAQLFE